MAATQEPAVPCHLALLVYYIWATCSTPVLQRYLLHHIANMKLLPNNFLYLFSVEGGTKFILVTSIIFCAIRVLALGIMSLGAFSFLTFLGFLINAIFLGLYIWAARGIKRKDARVALVFSYIYTACNAFEVLVYAIVTICGVHDKFDDPTKAPGDPDKTFVLTWPAAIIAIALNMIITYHFVTVTIAYARQLVIENNLTADSIRANGNDTWTNKAQAMAFSANESFWTGVPYRDDEEHNVPAPDYHV